MRKLLNRMGINQKFVISLFLLLIVPMAVLLLVVDVMVTNEIDKRTFETNFEQLKQTQMGIQTYTDAVKLVSLNIATDQDMQELINLYNNGATMEQKTRQQALVQFRINMELSENDQIRAVSVFTPQEIIYWYGDYVTEEDLQFVPQLDTLGGLPMWTDRHEGTYSSSHKGTRYIYILRAIRDLSNFEVIAYERLSVDEASLRKQYEGLTGGGSTILVMDAQGRVISATDPALMGADYSVWHFYPKMQKKEGYVQEKDTVVSWYTQVDTGWRVVKIDSAAWLCRNNGLYSMMILICILFTVIFGVVFFIIQRKTLIAPVTSISNSVRAFDKEHFEIPLYTDSNDEIGELNRNLSKLILYIQELILDQYELQIRRREIELKYMQSQINPHFLYNTLDSIRWMAVLENQQGIAEQIEALADVFRHALSRGRDVVRLVEEVEHLQNYILIQKKRFSDRIRFEITVESGLEDCQVLKLILQPLVENAIVHGLENKPEGGTIRIDVYSRQQTLCYRVEDDGLGVDQQNNPFPPTGGENRHNGFALRNIEERIKMMYGEEYGIEFHSVPKEGTCVLVRLPIIREETEGEEIK